jgi:MFS family permease
VASSSLSASAAFVRDRATWLAYLAVGLFAFLQASLGQLMPSLRDELGFGYALASIHFSAMALGLVAVGFAGDRIARRWGRAVAFWRGVAGLVAATLLLVISPIVGGTILGAFGIGACGSLLGITIQANLAERQRVRRAQAIAELNLASSACAVLATVAVGAAERSEVGWRGALVLAILAYGLIAIAFRGAPIEAAVPPGVGHRRAGRALPGAFWAYALVIFLGVSVDWCVAFWGADFLEKRGGLGRADAAAAMSAFFVAILAGRFAGSRLAPRLETTALLRGALLVTGSGFLLFWLSPVAPLAVAGLFVTGFGTANVFPFAFAAALDTAADRADLANARLALCGGAAVLLPPFALGLLADVSGIARAYAIVPPLLLAALVTALLAGRGGGSVPSTAAREAS